MRRSFRTATSSVTNALPRLIRRIMLWSTRSLRQHHLKLSGKCGLPGNMHIEPCAFPVSIQGFNGDWIAESLERIESLRQSSASMNQESRRNGCGESDGREVPAQRV